eukprot:TRINITY_DN11212_c0_g1_i1.p1 TRINITY_DN11212_c0_g1~~TRINITY_DN11212_c0_g1_i1.p1  ORF type:complete len:170 (-),score=30.12 TRINITY_DN11212_c0_g1_i1:50-559(-)
MDSTDVQLGSFAFVTSVIILVCTMYWMYTRDHQQTPFPRPENNTVPNNDNNNVVSGIISDTLQDTRDPLLGNDDDDDDENDNDNGRPPYAFPSISSSTLLRFKINERERKYTLARSRLFVRATSSGFPAQPFTVDHLKSLVFTEATRQNLAVKLIYQGRLMAGTYPVAW